MNYTDLLNWLAPETLLVVTTLAVLFIDLTVVRGEPLAVRWRWAAWVTVCGCGAAGAALFLAPASTPPEFVQRYEGMLVLSPLAQGIKAVLLLLSASTALISLETRFTRHAGE